MPAPKNARWSRDRWFGSIRISHDNRIRFSPWSFPGLPLAFWVSGGQITVLRAGRRVMYIYLDDAGKRVESACFDYHLQPDELREAVRTLCQVTGGLERWVVPALEWNSASSGVRADRPETFKIIPELLKSCRDLPVAKSWQRVRAQYFANAAERDARKAARTPVVEERRKAPQQGSPE